MNSPFFTVIIPSYNRAHLIMRAVKSIQAQTFPDWELIVIDDASTDNTADILQSINDDRITIRHNQENAERCLSRNMGVEMARGRFVCFLDSDDYHLPNHLQVLYDFIQSRAFESAFYFTNAWNETATRERSERFCPDYEKHNPYTYFLSYTVNPQRWCVTKEILLQHPFDPAVTICEDMDTSLRMLRAGVKIYQVKERTTVYVAEPDSFTHGDSEKAEKEFYFLKKIFARKELKGYLPLWPKRRLLSMCHFHLANKSDKQHQIAKTYQHIICSFWLYPPGYNGKTNLPMLVLFIKNLPPVSWLIQLIKTLKKQA